MKTGAFADLSHEFLFAKLHGMWAKALAGAPLQALIEGRADSALFRLLAERGIEPRDRPRVQKGLLTHLIGVLGGVMRLTGADAAAFYRRLIERFHIENLKTILHYRYFPERDVDIQVLLIESPFLPHLEAEALLDASSIHRFFQMLPELDQRSQLLPILVELDDSHDLFVAEAHLDQLYFRGLLGALPELSPQVREAAEELVKTEADVNNVIILLRNAALYNLPGDRIVELLLPGGALLTASAARQLAEAGNPESIRQHLPMLYKRQLEGLDPDGLHLWENGLWRLLYRQAYRRFRDFDQPGASVAAFPYLKRFETLNIGRIYEGFHFELETEDILAMMIGL
ncbi:MAG: V-type ATPase subunit [Kiritimatiellaeota bacterium]|nr:V-type ATPase subunit [Kiritimatiellota bacterium]